MINHFIFYQRYHLHKLQFYPDHGHHQDHDDNDDDDDDDADDDDYDDDDQGRGGLHHLATE